MPVITPNLGINKPLGSETFSRTAINANYDIIDSAVPTLISNNANRVINGNFAINQRVKSGTVTLAAGNYGHDRWKAGTTGCTYTFATTNNVTTITITAGSLVQSIEGINLLGGTYTLSWSGTAQGKIGAGSTGGSGITGTVTGGINIAIEFFVGTLSKVQFNAGSVALPFQPRSFGDELALCQRYYQKSYPLNTSPGSNSIIGGFEWVGFDTFNFYNGGNVEYKVPMRTVPTVIFYAQNGTLGNITKVSDNSLLPASADSNFSNDKRFKLSFNGTLVANAYYRFHYVADAEL